MMFRGAIHHTRAGSGCVSFCHPVLFGAFFITTCLVGIAAIVVIPFVPRVLCISSIPYTFGDRVVIPWSLGCFSTIEELLSNVLFSSRSGLGCFPLLRTVAMIHFQLSSHVGLGCFPFDRVQICISFRMIVCSSPGYLSAGTANPNPIPVLTPKPESKRQRRTSGDPWSCHRPIVPGR